MQSASELRAQIAALTAQVDRLEDSEHKRKLSEARSMEIAIQDAFQELRDYLMHWSEKHRSLFSVWKYPSDSRMVCQTLMAFGGSLLVTLRRRV